MQIRVPEMRLEVPVRRLLRGLLVASAVFLYASVLIAYSYELGKRNGSPEITIQVTPPPGFFDRPGDTTKPFKPIPRQTVDAIIKFDT